MIRELFDVDDPAYVGFLEMFISSFSAWGREPVPVLTRILRERQNPPGEPYYRKWLAESEGDVVGIVRGAYLPRAECGFIVHIAVSPKHRNRGLARDLLNTAEQGFLDDAKGRNYKGLLFEVERAQDAKKEAEREECLARLRFFDRFSARLVTPDYTQPPMGKWLPAMPLNLLLRPHGDPGKLESIVTHFYQDAFDMEDDQPWVQRAVLGVTGRLESPLRDVADTVPVREFDESS